MNISNWARRLTDLLRVDLPDIQVSANAKRVTWRYAMRTATVTDSGAEWWFSFGGVGAAAPTMASLFDTRHDEFTAFNFSRTLAGCFDDRFCTPRETVS